MSKATIETFVQGLGLPPPQAQSLGNTLQQDSNLSAFLSGGSNLVKVNLVPLACVVAQVIFGPDSVDTTPVNQTLVDVNWSEACWSTPTCVILPRTPKDVSVTLKIINFLQVKFSVRSGGHSPNPGWSSLSEPGVLIDLQRFNQITLSPDKSVVSLGTGQRWGKVYEALDSSGVTVIGGRIPAVGVGGLMLGGGYHHFSAQYGLAADNVKNFEIVLSDGTITDVNASKNPDLFSALKGGGPNFGIVTRFDLYTIPIKSIWYSVTVYATEQVPALLSAFVQWQNNGASDSKGTVGVIGGLDSTTVLLIYSEPVKTTPAAFAPFSTIPTLAVAVPPFNGTVLSVSQLLGTTFSNVPQRHDYRAVGSKIDLNLYQDVYNFWRTQALAVRASTGANQTFTIQPITASLVKAGIAKGGNAIGLPVQNFQAWTTLIDWTNASDDDTVRAVSIATTAQWKKLSAERGLSVPFEFMNDASRDQNPLASYGAASLAKLNAASKKYDQSQLFQKLQNDGFLLSRV